MSLKVKNSKDPDLEESHISVEFYLQEPIRFSLWGSVKYLLIFPAEVGEKVIIQECSVLSILFSLTEACPQRKLFQQSLSHLGEGKCLTPTPSRLPVSPNKVVKRKEKKKAEKHLWRPYPRNTVSLKDRVMYRIIEHLPSPIPTTISVGFLYNNRGLQLKRAARIRLYLRTSL